MELLSRCVYPYTKSLINKKCLAEIGYIWNEDIIYEVKEFIKYDSHIIYKEEILRDIKTIEKNEHLFVPNMFDRIIFVKKSQLIFSMINQDVDQDGRSTIVQLK